MNAHVRTTSKPRSCIASRVLWTFSRSRSFPMDANRSQYALAPRARTRRRVMESIKVPVARSTTTMPVISRRSGDGDANTARERESARARARATSARVVVMNLAHSRHPRDMARVNECESRATYVSRGVEIARGSVEVCFRSFVCARVCARVPARVVVSRRMNE